MSESSFVRSNRRIIRRLGIPIVLTNAQDLVLPSVKGIFKAPENDALVRGKSGGLSFKARGKTLKMMGEDCVGLTKDWVITINDDRYFAAKIYDKGHGLTMVHLTNSRSAVLPPEGDENGSKWR